MAEVEFERSSRAARRRRCAALTVLAATAVLASGCVTGPAERQSSEDPWVPATAESLGAWSTAYDTRLAEANEKLNPGALTSIQVGLLRQVGRAEYEMAERSGETSGIAGPFTHDDPTFYLPEFENYPLWMIVTSTNSESGAGILDYAVRPSAADDWRKQMSVTLQEGAELPPIEVDGQNRPTVLHPEEESGLRRTPGTIARAFAALLTAPDVETDYHKPFPEHELLEGQLDQNVTDAQAVEDGQATLDHAAEAKLIRAVRTEDGGALMFIGVEERRKIQIQSGTVKIGRNDPVAIFTGEREVSRSLAVSNVWQVALYVYPQGEGPEVADTEILGIRRGLVDAAVK